MPQNAPIHTSILERIGSTSLIQLRSLDSGDNARVLVKIESENPTGSMKDRMALAMIEAAEKDGRLTRGGNVVEYTGGSTGVSLALICGVRGYPLHIVTSDAFSIEKQDHMEGVTLDNDRPRHPLVQEFSVMPQNAPIHTSILERIGSTSLIQLRSLDSGDNARVLVKIESENPTGSMKDRMALAMIEAAEKDGRLTRGGNVVEYTGGSTGVSLALICGVKGYPLHIVTSDAFSIEKQDHMRALGAELTISRPGWRC